MKFGGNLKNLRNEKGLTQDELAQELSLAKSTISLYETNKREPDHNTTKKIADYFGVSVDFLMGRSSNREGSIIQSGDKTYTVIGSSNFTDEEWERIKNDFETIVALRKAQKEKR
jgi:transcriptional regulator with XRE-family HTH domain